MPDPFALFARSLRGPSGESPFAALDRLCQNVVGHGLFSCSRFDLDARGGGTAARIYSSDEENYPTSGVKDIVPNRWTGIVVDRHETFVANSVEEFSDVFPDHAFIASLGLGSVVNLPVLVRGTFLGTVNILAEAGFFTSGRLSRLGQLEAPSQLAFLIERQADTAH